VKTQTLVEQHLSGVTDGGRDVNICFTFWHSEHRASWYILIIKANKMHHFLTLFW